MRKAIRRMAFLAVALLLGGCNQVYSEKPLFDAGEVGAPRLKNGLWVWSKSSCVFNEKGPLRDWPKCAEWALLRAGQVLEFKDEDKTWTAADYVLAPGNPPILQIPDKNDEGTAYFYAALRPLKADALGQVVEFESWPVLCGPPPVGKDDKASPSAGADRANSYVTSQPLPRLEIKDDNCIARETGPVRAAAKASEAWASELQRSHWVRDEAR